MDDIRKKILFRCMHRGSKELDILIGTYAAAKLQEMDQIELQEFSAFIENDEVSLLAWLTADQTPPTLWEPWVRSIMAYQLRASAA